MKKFTLPISPSYVAHWQLWEAIRELIQNAYDQRSETGCDIMIEYDHQKETLTITTTSGHLTPQSLVLGNSTKEGKGLIGKFGEGYKLAFLVLTRLGHNIHVLQKGELWLVDLVFDQQFQSQVLQITSMDGDNDKEGVRIQVSGVSAEQYAAIERNYIFPPPKANEILKASSERGRIYVSGLYVTTNKDLHYGYSLLPATIKLDRDRGMVSDFDLQLVTSRLWEQRADSEMVKLIEDEAPDVSYLECYAPNVSHVSHHAPQLKTTSSFKVYESFIAKHSPDTVPCTTTEEVKAAQEAGSKWTLVPQILKSILNKVKSWVLPSRKSPLQRLEDLLSKVDGDIKAELQDIINTMKGSES